MDEIEVSEPYLDYLDKLVESKKAINDRQEAVEYCIDREVRFRS